MMNKSLVETLRKKGWTEEEIENTERLLSNRKPKNRFLDRFVYWFVLVITIIANMLLAIILIPFLLALSNVSLFLIIIIMALAFGFLFDVILRDLENLDYRHHVIAGVFIPAMAIITVYFMTSFANRLIDLFVLPNVKHSPLVIGLVYTVAFVTPYLIYRIFSDKYTPIPKSVFG